MKLVTHRGHRIAYDVTGQGPAVLLQHGMFSNRATWSERGFVEALAADHTVVTVDSLGHGESDKPADPRAYRPEARADDLAAVLDAVGARRAHLVGYSMGGWLVTAFAARHPARLLSLAIGGWDPVRGTSAAAPPGVTVDFAMVLAGVRARAPELAAWITPEAEPGVKACWEALAELEGSEAALAACPVPVLLWAGEADPCREGVEAVAARLPGATFRSAPGDHLGAMTTHAAESLATLREFLDEPSRGRRAPVPPEPR